MKKKKIMMLFLILLLTILSVPQIVFAATKAPKKIKLNKTKATMYVGKTITLKAKVSPSKAKKAVKWTSSNKKVATVTAKGKVKALSEGKAIITCRSKSKKKVKAKCTIIVKKKPASDEGNNNQGEKNQGENEQKKTIQQLDAETLSNARTIISLNGDAMNTWLFGKRSYSKTDSTSGNPIWSIVENKDGTIDYINLYKPGTNELIGCTDVINNFSDMTVCSNHNGDHTMYLMTTGQYDFVNDPDGALVCWNYWGPALTSSVRTKEKMETMFNGKISDEIYNKLMGYVDYPAVSGKGKELVIIYGKNAEGVLTARFAGYYIFKNDTYGLIGVASDNPDAYGREIN